MQNMSLLEEGLALMTLGMGPNVAGVIGSAVAAGVMIKYLG
ncbi:hypothetical protein [Halomonas sp. BM-2019]